MFSFGGTNWRARVLYKAACTMKINFRNVRINSTLNVREFVSSDTLIIFRFFIFLMIEVSYNEDFVEFC